nr:MAG TPA: hypothetical protein [Caudoviricetes sp.]
MYGSSYICRVFIIILHFKFNLKQPSLSISLRQQRYFFIHNI